MSDHKTYILKLKEDDEEKELQFELDYLATLTMQEMFEMIEEKSAVIKEILHANGHGIVAEAVTHE